MSPKKQPMTELKVCREFEPDRLSLTRLAAAYEKVVPKQNCVIVGQAEQNTQQQDRGKHNVSEASSDLRTSVQRATS